MLKFVVAAAAVCALAGCGSSSDDGPTVAGPPPAETAQQDQEAARAKAEAQYANCNRDLGAFVTGLGRLDNRLRAGLGYDAYTTGVDRVRAAYEHVPKPPEDPECTSGVGIPAEKALRQHLEASKAWEICQSKANCTNDTVKPRLQRYWVRAAGLTDRAKSNLEGLRTP